MTEAQYEEQQIQRELCDNWWNDATMRMAVRIDMETFERDAFAKKAAKELFKCNCVIDFTLGGNKKEGKFVIDNIADADALRIASEALESVLFDDKTIAEAKSNMECEQANIFERNQRP